MDKGQNCRLLIVVYLLFSLVNIVGEQFAINWMVIFSKPLLIPILIFWFFNLVNLKKPGSRLLIIALIAAWLGDVLLLLHHQNIGDLFLAGIGCFAITQILYTISLYKFHGKSFFENKWGLVLITVLGIMILMFILPKTESAYVYPVAVYSILISAMLYQALTLSLIKPNLKIILFGAGLFYISDLTIAISQFAKVDFGWLKAGTLIMLTYLAAQLLIVMGFRKYYQ